MRTIVGSQPRYSPIPPQTPASILFVRDFLSLAAIDDLRYLIRLTKQYGKEL